MDLLAHDDLEMANRFEATAGREFVRRQDWWEALSDLNGTSWDVVIANDLFPNVDQRLRPFLDSVLPNTVEARLSLTYYVQPRWYVTRRIDADEILTLMAWDHRQLEPVLRDFEAIITDPDFRFFGREGQSVYPNGRHVAVVNLSSTDATG